MEWTVVTALVVLVGLFFTIGKPILSVCGEIKELQIQGNQEKVDMTETKNQLKELVQIAQNHEIRIHDLEQDIKQIKSTE